MKSIILTLLLSLYFINQSSAQQYVQMPTSNAVWLYRIGSGGGGTHVMNRTIQLMLTGADTTINGLVYKQIIARNYDTVVSTKEKYTYPEYNIAADKPDVYYGGIREENKRVFLLRYTNPWSLDLDPYAPLPSEDSLYDFNLQVGDTLFNTYMKIMSIDSVQVGPTYRKRFKATHLFDPSRTKHYIEGLGCAEDGLFTGSGYNPDHGLYSSFVCFTHSGIQFQPAFAIPCHYLWPYGMPTSVNNIVNEETKIYPNPFTDELTIESENAEKAIVYNAMGQAVLQEKINGKVKLSTSGLSTGLYHIILQDKTGNPVHSQKVIKQ